MEKIKAKLFLIEKQPYLVRISKETGNAESLYLFVINNGNKKNKYAVGYFDDFLGAPIKEVYEVIAEPESIGLKYVHNKLGTHGDNNKYTTELTKGEIKDIVENDGYCEIESELICPNYGGKHIGQDCSCKTGFIDVPKLKEGKVVFV